LTVADSNAIDRL